MRLFKNIKNIEIYRYGIISPVLQGNQQSQNQYFRQLSEKGIKIPPDNGDIFHLDPSTFKRWLRQYRKHGLQGLKEKSRSDKGTFRKIPSHLLDAIASVIQEAGAVSVSDLHRKLLMKDILFRTIQQAIMEMALNKKTIPIIIFDDAHFLRNENFFELQLLSNFNFDSLSPALFILIAQPHLQERLRRPAFDSFYVPSAYLH